MNMPKVAGWTWSIFIVIAATLLLYMFFFVDVGKTVKEVTLQDNFNQTAHITTEGGSGSGVLVNPWAVLTACHVVVTEECSFTELNLEPVKGIVINIAGRTFAGKVTKFDPYSDLAYVELITVLGVSKTTHADGSYSGTDPVTVSCDPLTISRDLIYGIGFPMAMEKNIKSGVISALNGTFPGYSMISSSPPWARTDFADIAGMFDREYKYFTLFDITLLPGNSGGGIFDKRGHLIGITSHIMKHPEKIQPQAGPNSSIVAVPSGYTYATKPQRICEFLQSLPDYVNAKTYKEMF